jgi:hypothetical protein
MGNVFVHKSQPKSSAAPNLVNKASSRSNKQKELLNIIPMCEFPTINRKPASRPFSSCLPLTHTEHCNTYKAKTRCIEGVSRIVHDGTGNVQRKGYHLEILRPGIINYLNLTPLNVLMDVYRNIPQEDTYYAYQIYILRLILDKTHDWMGRTSANVREDRKSFIILVLKEIDFVTAQAGLQPESNREESKDESDESDDEPERDESDDEFESDDSEEKIKYVDKISKRQHRCVNSRQ